MLRLFFIFIFITLTMYAKLNLEVVAEHNGNGNTVQSKDIVFSGDNIKFYFNSNEKADLDIFTMNKGTKEKIYSQKLEKDTSYSFPSNNDWITLDENTGIETFVFHLNGEVVKVFELNHISQKVDPSKDVKAKKTKNSIEDREYIDLSKVRSNTRGATDIKIFNNLSNTTVIVKAKDEIGAGVIISKEGDILTNWHVVKTNQIVTVAFKPRIGNKPSKSNYYNAEVVKIDKVKDLALLRLLNTEIVEDKQIKPISFADIKNIEVGEDIYTIGHPIGYYYSLGNGIISNILNDHSWKTQQMHHEAKYIIKSQTSISSGNSGGPLVNKEMQLLGLMTYSDTQGQNLNFSVSIKDIKDFLQQPSDSITNKKYLAKKSKNMKDTSLTSSSHSVTVLKEMKVYDLDGSPMVLRKVDTNGNGIPDQIYLDTNSDNFWDRIYYDRDEDGLIGTWKDF